MLHNFIKIALRTLFRNKWQSALLIGGLATGMTACLLLLQYVGFELSFDSFHSKKDRIYRVVNERIQNGKTIQKGTITYPTIGRAMQNDYPEIANHTRMAPEGNVAIRTDLQSAPLQAQNWSGQQLLWVDEHLFEMFDFPMLAASSDKLLNETNQVVLTRTVAGHCFPGAKDRYELMLGKEVYLGKYPDAFKVVGICDDVPDNSILQFHLLASFATYIRYRGKEADESWQWSDFWHFIELSPGADAAQLQAKFPEFSERYFRGAEVSGSEEIFTLQPLTDAHLYSTGLEYEIGKVTNGKAVWSLLIIAFFILLIAWINYLNLSSVRAIERAKEVGVRKVVGARRSTLIWQFLTEAFLVNLLALGIAFVATGLIKPWFASNFNLETGSLGFNSFNNFLIPASMVSILIAGVALSGIYPAFLLSSPHVSNVLKGVFQKSLGGGGLRKGLVVFQFTASIALIVATWQVSRQITYMNHMDLGVNIDRIITVDGPQLTSWDSTFIEKTEALKAQLLRNPHVKSVTTSNRTIDDNWHGRVFRIEKTGDDADNIEYTSSFIITDYDYARTYGLEPVAGRFFEYTDHNADFDQLDKVVVNTEAVKKFGYASNADAIGKSVKFWGTTKTIIGVVPDFHELSLHHPIEPLLFIPAYGPSNKYSMLIDGNDTEATLADIKATYAQFFPNDMFGYKFLNSSYQRLYDADRQFGRILQFFTVISILIACLGLLGLASYMTFLRMKEIGVRKVLGASTAGIVSLLSRDFLKLVLISLVIASPIAWYFMRAWLDEFPYRITIEWWVFAIAGAAALTIAFITVSLQSIRAAISNPVESLRSE